jgi:hypothetical protein
MSICLTPARAAASRRNGAKSQGPRTEIGKARAARNALKHGLCAERYLVADEDAQAFAALEATLLEELAPEGVLQRLLAGRIVRAAWRLERAERIEAELFENQMRGDSDLALAVIRDGHGTRSFDTLLRYRGSALAELFRAVRMLKALQDEARTIVVPEPARPQRKEPNARTNAGVLPPSATVGSAAPHERTAPGAALPPRDRAVVPRDQPSRSTP